MSLIIIAAALLAADDKIDAADLAAIKKAIAGRVTLDKRSGTIQIVYDLRLPKQGADFVVSDKPAIVKNGLQLKPSVVATHVVPWQSVAVEAGVQVPKMGGTVLTADQSKVSLGLGGDNSDTVYLQIANPKLSKQVIVPVAERSGLKTILLELNESTSVIGYSSYQISEPTKLGAAGKIEFHGGNYGYGFRSIVFRGKPDPEWLKGLAAKK